jgi:hypothetical protein
MLAGAMGQFPPAKDTTISVPAPPGTAASSGSDTTSSALLVAASPPPALTSCTTGCKISCTTGQCLVKRSECSPLTCKTCMANTCYSAPGGGNPCPKGTCGVSDMSNVCYPRMRELGKACLKCVTCIPDVWGCPGSTTGTVYASSSVPSTCGTGDCVTCSPCQTTAYGRTCHPSAPTNCANGTVAYKKTSYILDFYPCSGPCWQRLPTV